MDPVSGWPRWRLGPGTACLQDAMSPGGTPFIGPVALGSDGSGNVLAACGQYDSSSGTISVADATLSAGGSWSASATLATPAGSAIRQVSVAVNSNAAAVVAWIKKYNDLFGDVVTRPAVGSFGHRSPSRQDPGARRCSSSTPCRSQSTLTVAQSQQANGTWAPETVFAKAYANPAPTLWRLRRLVAMTRVS
jgi:hypothetical protein